MYKVVYMGGIIEPIFEAMVNARNLKIIGAILDKTMKDEDILEYQRILKEADIQEYNIEDIEKLNPDLILVPYYTKIIKSELINKYIFLNIHAGILPKWRGFNSNCWAILNGEKKVGYTLHRIREELDAGEIYTIIETELEEEESYYTGKSRILERLYNELESIIINVLEGRLLPRTQDKKGFVYNCRLKADDGNITEWNKTSRWIQGLMKVFDIKTGGSGVHISVKGVKYAVLALEMADEILDFVGIPGSVINSRVDGAVLIKTQDNAIWIKELLTQDGERIIPSNIMKIGMRL